MCRAPARNFAAVGAGGLQRGGLYAGLSARIAVRAAEARRRARRATVSQVVQRRRQVNQPSRADGLGDARSERARAIPRAPHRRSPAPTRLSREAVARRSPEAIPHVVLWRRVRFNGAELSRFHGYRAINRPYSVVQYLKSHPVAACRGGRQSTAARRRTVHARRRPGGSDGGVSRWNAERARSPARTRSSPEGSRQADARGRGREEGAGAAVVRVIFKRDLAAKVSSGARGGGRSTDAGAPTLRHVLAQHRDAAATGSRAAAARGGPRHHEFRAFVTRPARRALDARRSAARARGVASTSPSEYTPPVLDAPGGQPWTIGDALVVGQAPGGVLTPPHSRRPSNVAAFWLTNAFNEAMACERPRRSAPAAASPTAAPRRPDHDALRAGTRRASAPAQRGAASYGASKTAWRSVGGCAAQAARGGASPPADCAASWSAPRTARVHRPRPTPMDLGEAASSRRRPRCASPGGRRRPRADDRSRGRGVAPTCARAESTPRPWMRR